MLDLPRLVILRAVSLHGSITAAARELSYSHSAVSQQLSVLESEVGVALLERVGRSVQLTPAGGRLVHNTEAILSAVETAESDLARSDHVARGVVRIAAFATISRNVMPRALKQLAVDYPGLDVSVQVQVPEEAAVRLSSRQVDAVLIDSYSGVQVTADEGIHATKLAADPIRAYMPAGVDAASPEALRTLPWVVEPYDTAATQWMLRTCREHGFEPLVVHVSADLLFHVRMVEAGLAAAFLPDMVIREVNSTIRPSAHLPSDRHRRILFLTRSGAEGHPALTAVRDAVAGCLPSPHP